MANPNSRGQQRDKPFRDALRMELAALGEDSKALRAIARNLIADAQKPENALPAIKEIADRLDGRPAQAIENGEDGAFEVIQRIERVIARPADPNG